jgi:hypothetical protein
MRKKQRKQTMLDGLIGPEYHEHAHAEHNEPVGDVAEHDPEEEGEGDQVEDCRVDLFVSGDSIGSEDLVRRLHGGAEIEESRLGFPGQRDELRQRHSILSQHFLQPHSDFLNPIIFHKNLCLRERMLNFHLIDLFINELLVQKEKFMIFKLSESYLFTFSGHRQQF